MNTTNRRHLLKAALAPMLASLATGVQPALAAAGAPAAEVTEIRIIQTKNPKKILEQVSQPGFSTALSRAVLGFVLDNYGGGNLPVWKKPTTQIDLQSRIPRIAEQVVSSIMRHASIFPVDPCWIMGQMMSESFFYEFAISSALAVGPCQFISATAKGYGLICADARQLDASLLQSPELDANWERANTLRRQTRDLRTKYGDIFKNPSKILRELIAAHGQGQSLNHLVDYGKAFKQVDELQAQYVQARNKYRQFLEDNFAGRSIFNPDDVTFFERFEQRVLYHHSIDAMVRMMAENMRSRNGNILAATAGYNAGPGNTASPSGVYASYGRIPNFTETVDYVSKILVNHYEIARRI